MVPFQRSLQWIETEKGLGSPHPERMVLATTDTKAQPHCRIVAIRDISEQGFLFFTQRGSRKAQEIKANPQASATIWLPLQQREIIIEGRIQALSEPENEVYWQNLNRERQLKFASFTSTPDQAIDSHEVLQRKMQALAEQYPQGPIPRQDCYCGYRLEPKTFYFYTLNDAGFSEYIKYQFQQNAWQGQLLSP